MDAIWIVIISLLTSAFASGTEIAFLSANKLRIELDRKHGSFPARIIWFLAKSPAKFIATLLIANNVALVIYGITMSERILSPEFIKSYLPIHSQVALLLTQTVISTLIILVAAEFIPKVLFRIDPNRTLNFLAVPFQILYYLLYPIVWVILGLSKFVLQKILRAEFAEERPVFGRVDLDFYIKDISTRNDQKEEADTDMQMFQNALDFTEVKVRECMVPRKEIVAIDVEDTIVNLQKMFVETKHSRILVYRENIDNVVGFVHSNEMFKRPQEIQNVLLPIAIVPEVMAADALLQLFIDQHRTIAVVVDEFGGTSGVVTIEDVMEEIFGEIRDEHDVDETIEKKISDYEFIFSGRLEIDTINRKYELGIPEGEPYETLAGFIIHHHENIPVANEEIIISPFTFTILQVKDNRIEQVRMKINREGE